MKPSALALALPDKPSIAALPFLNLSGDPEQEYFTDGVVEDIISALSRIGWLFVIARNSSFAYKGQAVDVKQIGRELGVRYVLEGSVRKATNRVRITGQLIDATTGGASLGGAFRGRLDDIFDLQDQVAAERRRRDRAATRAGGDRPRQAQADREPRRLRLLPPRHGAISSRDQGGNRRGAAIVLQGDRPRSGFRLGLRDGRGVPFLAEAERLDHRSLRGDRRGRATGAARRRAWQGRRRRARPRRPRPGAARRRPRWRHRPLSTIAGAQSEPCGRMVPRRLPENLARRAGRGDRTPRPRHASEPARFRRCTGCRVEWRTRI